MKTTTTRAARRAEARAIRASAEMAAEWASDAHGLLARAARDRAAAMERLAARAATTTPPLTAADRAIIRRALRCYAARVDEHQTAALAAGNASATDAYASAAHEALALASRLAVEGER